VAEALWAGAAQGARAAKDRHADALRRACDALERAAAAARHSTLEVVSGEVGLALGALAELTGEDASQALLDAVFRRFCIGK
jgi:tRNA modification GTPase